MSRRADRLAQAMRDGLGAERVEVEDESRLHAGHAGTRGSTGGETHYAMLVVAGRFEGLSRVARSRLVHEKLAGEFEDGLHALSLTLRTPREEVSSGALPLDQAGA